VRGEREGRGNADSGSTAKIEERRGAHQHTHTLSLSLSLSRVQVEQLDGTTAVLDVPEGETILEVRGEAERQRA